MHIERPKGLDITEERVTLTLRDENALRVGTVTITANDFGQAGEVVRVSVERGNGDQNLRVEFAAVN